MRFKIYFFLIILFLSNLVSGQENTLWTTQNDISLNYSTCINQDTNTIQNAESLKTLLHKLRAIKNGENQQVTFVHLGDSHIQADMLTAVIRKAFQNYFGNAGRGLVFPYQVIKTNGPTDLIFSSTSSWKGNRLAKKDSIPACGISGFGMVSQQVNPEFAFDFRTMNGEKETFDYIEFFLGTKNSPFKLETTTEIPEQIEQETTLGFTTLALKTPASGFKIHFNTQDTIPFYGINLKKKNQNGIIYDAIGVNGAKYSDYNKTSLFWSQQENLKADCFILSLGTNEAQNQELTSEEFIKQVDNTIIQIKKTSPNASIIITTPPVSFFKKHKPNKKLAMITNALIAYCTTNQIAYWDLFSISKGLKGSYQWKTKRLLRPDLVHYSKEGYELQGNLFVNAFIALWNQNGFPSH
ncbi:MAG: GDSL-type esterase/lipase family protein [Flavobacterium sp.]